MLLILFPSVTTFVREAASGGRRGWELVRVASLRVLPWVLFVTFLVVPDLSSLAFQMERCECFGDKSFLRSDYTLQCTAGGCGVEHRTPEYQRVRRDAWAVIWVYAIGVPCLYALCLFHERRIIMDERRAPLADALDFLHGGYRPTCYFWELVNLMHKQFAVGFATIILPGTMRQLMIVGLMMVIYLLLLVVVKPYRSFEAWLLAIVEQSSLLIFMAVCFIVKAEQLAMQVLAFSSRAARIPPLDPFPPRATQRLHPLPSLRTHAFAYAATPAPHDHSRPPARRSLHRRCQRHG